MKQIFEGSVYNTPENKQLLHKMMAGEKIEYGTYIEQRCVACRDNICLFEFGKNVGIMAKDELSMLNQPKKPTFLVNAVAGFFVKDITVSEGKTTYWLSRVAVQNKYYAEVLCDKERYSVLDGRITAIKDNTAFVDIGYGILTVIYSADTTILRMGNITQFFAVGEDIKVLLLEKPSKDAPMFKVSHKELLGTWSENCQSFKPGDVVTGRVTTIHEYGTFIALTSNLTALADPLKDEAYQYAENDMVSVTIKSIVPEKSKIKCKINTSVASVTPDGVMEKQYYLGYPFLAKGNCWCYNEENTVKPYVVDFDRNKK